ncbi:MAG: hypothetical protein AMJ81_10305 [Phycisphaerae bacterium SM23_33]|nr:MAG: hypothetical protein AMJ81_10305 [Phycisphaerae bacterium SM23_33]
MARSCLDKGYHTPADTADKINAAGAIEVLAVADAILTQLWAGPKRIAYQPPKPGPGRAAMAAAVLVPAAVAVAAPAATSLPSCPRGPEAVQAYAALVAELLAALHASRPGREVALKVRRSKKTIEVKVTLGKR